MSLAGPQKTPVRIKMLADFVEYLQSEKLCQPSMYSMYSICYCMEFLPMVIYHHGLQKKCFWEDCRMTKRKVSHVPKESLSLVRKFLIWNTQIISLTKLDNITIWNFIKTNVLVIVTSGGESSNSYSGETGIIEIQCSYALNAFCTI